MKKRKLRRAILKVNILGLLCWIICCPAANAGDVTVEILPPNYLSCGGLEVAAQGSDDSLILETAVWDWDDGVVESAWIPANHQYLQNGDFTISLTLAFETGETASDTHDISISNAKDVGCGLIDRVQLEPAYLMLSAEEHETGQLTIRVWDSDGLEGQTTEFSSQFVMDANPYAAINVGTGLVTAVTPLGVPLARGRLSTDGISWVDGSNAVRVRVTKTDLHLEYIPMRGRQITYYLPRVISSVHLESLAMQYQLVEATDLSYQAQAFGNGYVPFTGHTQYLVVDADKIEDPAEDTLPCGSSGNPIGIGWAIDAINGTYGGCFIYSEGVSEVQLNTPRWSIIFHEIGHSFFGESRALEQINSAYNFHGITFTEGMASFGAVWSLWSLLNCPTQLSPATLATIQAEFSDWKAARAELLANYQAGGPNFDEFDSETLIATLFDLYDDYGPKVWYDYYSLFYPKDGSLSCTLDSLSDQFGMVAATISASTGEDLRGRFRTEYGFHIVDDDWPNLLSCAQQRVNERSFSVEAACAAVAPVPPLFVDGFEAIE